MNIASTRERGSRKSVESWYLVTNHLNLLYMLGAGLVMEPSGFHGKHYVDTLATIPGWIPLFRNTIPAKAFEQVVSERKHLRPCVVLLDLSGISGSVQVLSREGKIRDASFSSVRLGKGDVAILIQAPLPLTLFSRICFVADEDKKAFEVASKDVSNVDLRPYRIEVDDSLQCNANDAVWPPVQIVRSRSRNTRQKEANSSQGDLLEAAEDSLQVSKPLLDRQISAQALGGMLAMLYHCANRSKLGVESFQLATGSARKTDGICIQDPILAELPRWLNTGEVSEQSSTPARLYWGAMNALVAAQQRNSSQPVHLILEYLDSQLTQLTDEKYKSRLDRLITDMRGFFGLGGGTITELFERNKGSLSRPLLLFCLRERCNDLLEFTHPLLNDAEHLLAGLLFGVRDGWMRLPIEMRNQNLSAYVMHRMASAAHQKNGDDLSFPIMARPQPLRAFFPSETDAWQTSQTLAALEIAKRNKWRDCVETIISSPDGSPLEPPRSENQTFIFSGEATAKLGIRHKVFLDRFGKWPPIDADLESRVKKDLNSTVNSEANEA
jgi:hypothetical protein